MPPSDRARSQVGTDAAVLRSVVATLSLLFVSVACQSETARIRAEAPKRVGASALTGPAFPLKASPNGRYLVDQNGAPFLIVGDSAQDLFENLSLADAASYLDTRKAQGFNTLLVELLSLKVQIPTTPRSANGALPFLKNAAGGSYDGTPGTVDFWGNGGTSINTPYWDYVDSVMDLAAQRGMLLVVYELPWAFDGSPLGGWWSDLINGANTKSKCQAFGSWLGSRYAGRQNIIWLDGSDHNGDSTPRAPDNTDGITRGLAIAQGMRAAGAVQLRSGDWRAPSLSTDEAAFAPLMQVNGIYSYGGLFPQSQPAPDAKLHTYLEARAGYNYVPTSATQGVQGASRPPLALPAFLKETAYEHSPFVPGDAVSLRKAQWWAVLSGGTGGLLYGNENIWEFIAPAWRQSLSDPGALDMQRMASFMQSIAWQNLVPSELAGTRRLVTSANGTQSGEPDNYVAAAQSSDGTLLVAFTPASGNGPQSLTVDTRGLRGTSRARWWDPTSGDFSSVGTVLNTGTQTFTTPGAHSDGTNDWLLVLDVLSQGAAVPATPPWVLLMLLCALFSWAVAGHKGC